MNDRHRQNKAISSPALNTMHQPIMPEVSLHKQPGSAQRRSEKKECRQGMAVLCVQGGSLQRQPGTRWRLSFTGLTIRTLSPSAQPGRRCNSQPAAIPLYTVSRFIVCKVNRGSLCRPLHYRPRWGLDMLYPGPRFSPPTARRRAPIEHRSRLRPLAPPPDPARSCKRRASSRFSLSNYT